MTSAYPQNLGIYVSGSWRSDEGRDSLAAINDLRKAVNATQPVRLVGLSGVGKTRLVQALFDVRIETAEPALNPGNVIYTDVSDQPDPQEFSFSLV